MRCGNLATEKGDEALKIAQSREEETYRISTGEKGVEIKNTV
jgi:hypothetical protein